MAWASESVVCSQRTYMCTRTQSCLGMLQDPGLPLKCKPWGRHKIFILGDWGREHGASGLTELGQPYMWSRGASVVNTFMLLLHSTLISTQPATRMHAAHVCMMWIRIPSVCIDTAILCMSFHYTLVACWTAVPTLVSTARLWLLCGCEVWWG